MKREFSNTAIGELEATIRDIGVARFVGRINSGVVETEVGYKALDSYVAKTKQRPALSRLASFLLDKDDALLAK